MPGVSIFGVASPAEDLLTKPICGPAVVALLCALAIVFAGFAGEGLGVSTPCSARPNEALPFTPESELAVKVCFSLVCLVPKEPASWLAAITFRTKETNETPDVAEADVELAVGICFLLVSVLPKVPTVGLAGIKFRTGGANETPDVVETTAGVGAG